MFHIAKLGTFGMYWADVHGWTDRDNADIYTWDESRNTDLPEGGVWISVQQKKPTTPDEFAKTLSETPPVPTDLKVGDPVIFTNDYGVTFEQTVIGFEHKVETQTYSVTLIPSNERIETKREATRLVYLDTDCFWFAVRLDQLEKIAA